jgi:hypothetical protein
VGADGGEGAREVPHNAIAPCGPEGRETRSGDRRERLRCSSPRAQTSAPDRGANPGFRGRGRVAAASTTAATACQGGDAPANRAVCAAQRIHR